MTYSILFHPAALAEYQYSFEWYEYQLPSLGERFETEIEIALNKILQNPEAYSY